MTSETAPVARTLEGKVALVTGAGSGVGVGLALALAKAGAIVGLVGRTAATLEETAAKIAAASGRSLILPCDVTDRSQVNSAIARLAAAHGPVWVLVNNAVFVELRGLEDVTDEHLDRTLRGTIHGSLYMMQGCFPAMRERGGRIVNFGSGGATMGVAEVGAYVIAKEGLRGLTKTAASGWGKFGITVNTICPMVITPTFNRWWTNLSDQRKEDELSEIPLGRWADAETDVGALVVFLAGPGGGAITGRTLHVDGGRAYYDR